MRMPCCWRTSESSLFLSICYLASKSLFPFQFTLWNGELFRKTLPGFNSAEATGAQHGQDQAFLAWVRMKPLQHLWGWWAEDGQSKKLLVISQMMLPRGGWVWKGLITGIASLTLLEKYLHWVMSLFQKIIKLGSLQAVGLCLPSPWCSSAWQCLCFCWTICF